MTLDLDALRFAAEETVRRQAKRRANGMLEQVRAGEFEARVECLERIDWKITGFSVDLNGPTTRVWFVTDEDGDLRFGFIAQFDGGEEAHQVLGQWAAEELYAAMKDYA